MARGYEGEEKRDKRQMILDAAVKVFSRHGYHEARMEEIAAEAGIGKGTIYEYFTSKLELFQEMLNKSREVYYDSLEIDDKKKLSLREKIYFLFLSHIQFCRENKELTRIVFWDTKIMDEELKVWSYDKRKEKEKMFREEVREAIERREIRKVDPELVSLNVSGLLSALWAPITLDGWDVDPEELAEKLTDLIFAGLKPE
ncbi:TetR/AcrR family transcriptional regulator [Thermosyntropha sp.]|uniref:TetR/AcrR family transcriptional regulator n=1 Tax=Thermosyntropha sp. TaxID=2740820 RepID=UPI0025E98CBA|nr:TetR/AcrR family transcriptional regulator [Thermosyntropha sp.]MBO8159059.1 TetR/AcrR family transcriptional regulator [Thermosyntropha sp.]